MLELGALKGDAASRFLVTRTRPPPRALPPEIGRFSHRHPALAVDDNHVRRPERLLQRGDLLGLL